MDTQLVAIVALVRTEHSADYIAGQAHGALASRGLFVLNVCTEDDVDHMGELTDNLSRFIEEVR